MDIFFKDELQSLLGIQTVSCISISIYLPTARAGRAEVQHNSVRLKKLLGEAQERLEKIGLRRTEAEAYLQPIKGLLNDDSFWLDISDGLAIFLSNDYFRYYRLPIQLPELLVVSNRFQIKPLLPMLTTDERFYILAISQKAVRLLQCTRFSVHEIDIAGKVPRSLSEALRFDDVDREAQFHHHSSMAGIDGGVVTARGSEVEETKENLLRFFFLADKSLQRNFLHEETSPLILVSVDYLFPIYKKANTYKYLLEKGIEVSPDRLNPSELHRLGLNFVEPYFKKEQEEAVRHYYEFAGLGRTTDILEEITSESYNGRVHILFVAANQQKWGSYDHITNKAEAHPEQGLCDVDLLDFAAAHTLAHRGKVYIVEVDKMPGGASAAAVLRY